MENNNAIGPKKAENKYENEFKGKLVKISCGPNSAMGILQKVEGYSFYLKPSVVYHNLAQGKPGEWKYLPNIMYDNPSIFEVTPPFLVEPIKEGYLEEFVKSYENWNLQDKNDSI